MLCIRTGRRRVKAHAASLRKAIAEQHDLASGAGRRILDHALASGGNNVDDQLKAARKNVEAIEGEARGMAENKGGATSRAAQDLAARLADTRGELSRLEAQKKAEHDAIEAERRRAEQVPKAVEAMERRASEAGWGDLTPVAKAMEDHQKLLADIARLKDPKARADLSSREQAYSSLVIPLVRSISDKERADQAAFDKGASKESAARIRGALEIVWGPYLQSETSRLSADEKIKGIEASSTREDILRRSSRVVSLTQLQAPIGQEDRAAIVGIQERLRLAQELKQIELDAAEKIKDEDDRRLAEARALADFHKADLDARPRDGDQDRRN